MARLPVLRGNSCGKIPEHRRAASRPPQVRTQRALAETERIPGLPRLRCGRKVWDLAPVGSSGVSSRGRRKPSILRLNDAEGSAAARTARRWGRSSMNTAVISSRMITTDTPSTTSAAPMGQRLTPVCSSGSAPQQQNLGGGGLKAASREHPTASSVTADGNSEAPGKTADAWRLPSRTELTGITRARTRRHSVITAKQRCRSTIAVPPNWFGWRACRAGLLAALHTGGLSFPLWVDNQFIRFTRHSPDIQSGFAAARLLQGRNNPIQHMKTQL